MRDMGVRVTVVELPAAWGDPRRALDDVDAILRDGLPTDLVILPEAALTGYVSRDGDFDLSRFAEPLDGRTATMCGDLAADHNIQLLAPLILREDDTCFNAAALFGPSGRASVAYKKRHPWYPEGWATAGRDQLPLVRIGDLNATIAICFDLHFLPVESAHALSAADLLLFPSAWVDDQEAARIPLMTDLARHFKIHVANANWAPGVVTYKGQGDSCIVDATGTIVARVAPGGHRADAYLEPRPRTTTG
jgi:predicted amidohydrolase